MKKKVFIETHNINNQATGFGTFNYELIKGFEQHPYENLELHLNSKKPSLLKSEFGQNFEYHKCYGFHRYKNFRSFNKYDLWHSVNQNTKIEPRFNTRYVLTIHDVNFFEEVSSDLENERNKRFIEKLKRATAITYISQYAKKQTHNYFDVPNVPEQIIYNGNPISELLDTSSYSSNVPVNKPFFYTIGDFLERKNYGSLIEMMKLIKDYNLIISGNNNKKYGEEIKDLIVKNGLENKIFLTGKVSNVGKQFYIKNCEAFLFPSIREGFGLPPIEAMRFGKPVFMSDKTSLPEIGGDVANYWNNFDPEYMRDVVYEGLNNYENEKQLKKHKLMERALFFDWKKASGEYLELYKSVLNNL